MTTATGQHHHHWVLVDGYNSAYECACGATRGDRTAPSDARPDARPDARLVRGARRRRLLSRA